MKFYVLSLLMKYIYIYIYRFLFTFFAFYTIENYTSGP
jgi:hypothetical protein